MNSVEDIALATAVETRDSVELWVEASDCCPVLIGLEAVEHNFSNIHSNLSNACAAKYFADFDRHRTDFHVNRLYESHKVKNVDVAATMINM